MNGFRKLLVLGANELILAGKLDLAGAGDDHGHIRTEIAGKPSVISWRGIGFDEVRISVWWDYNHDNHPQANHPSSPEQFHTATPLAKRSSYPRFVGVMASGWMERRNGKYLQGRGLGGITSTYLRRGETANLDALPDPIGSGFAVEGGVS